MVPKRYILPPPSLKPWPEIEGYESVFVGSGVYQALMPRGVQKFATILTTGNDEWFVTDYKKDLVYPAGQDELFYVFYFNKKKTEVKSEAYRRRKKIYHRKKT